MSVKKEDKNNTIMSVKKEDKNNTIMSVKKEDKNNTIMSVKKEDKTKTIKIIKIKNNYGNNKEYEILRNANISRLKSIKDKNFKKIDTSVVSFDRFVDKLEKGEISLNTNEIFKIQNYEKDNNNEDQNEQENEEENEGENEEDEYIKTIKCTKSDIEYENSVHPFLRCCKNIPYNGEIIVCIDQLLNEDYKKISIEKIKKDDIEEINESWKIMDIVEKRPPQGWVQMFKNSHDEFYMIEKYLKDKEGYYPLKKDLFRAFELCPAKEVKVVIVGQDPYHTTDKQDNKPTANGMSFSARKEPSGKIPRSLKNIFNRITETIPGTVHNHPDLTYWANQGILLLNTCLTVKPHKPGSHNSDIYIPFINNVVKEINKYNPNCIYVLWGRNAQKSMSSLLNNKNVILKSSHPSPHSYKKTTEPFSECDHFNIINKILTEQGKTVIDWSIY
jgi:uracil-DNA glycosylase